MTGIEDPDGLARALYNEFGMNLNPHNPAKYWEFVADGIRRNWLAEHDAEIRAEQIEKDAVLLLDRRPHIPPSTAPDRRQCIIERSTLNRAAAAIRAQLNEGATDE